VVATTVEIAFTHTRMPVASTRSVCLAAAPAHPRDGRVEFRSDPQWFTDYTSEGISEQPARAPRRRQDARVDLTTP